MPFCSVSFSGTKAAPLVYVLATVFFATVGVAQVLLFKGNDPRRASCVAGGVVTPVLLVIDILLQRAWGIGGVFPAEDVMLAKHPAPLAFLVLVGSPMGLALGYLAGALDAGIFLVLDRRWSAGVPKPPEGTVADWRYNCFAWLQPIAARWKERQANRHEQARHPVRYLLMWFFFFGVLPSLVAPFCPWPWGIHVITAMIFGFLFAGGMVGCNLLSSWRSLLVFLVLGPIAAIGPVAMLGRIRLIHGFATSSIVPVGVVFPLGIAFGMVSAGTLGWVGWLLGQNREGANCTRQRALSLGAAVAIGLFVLSGALTWWLFRVSQWPAQRALSRIEELGGTAISSSFWPCSPTNDVFLEGPGVTDEDMALLAALDQIAFLGLHKTRVTDAGLDHLRGMYRLTYLLLAGTPITDAGLARLRNIPGLQSLDLRDTRITDAALEEVKTFSSLQTLVLDGTKITDAGLARLAGLKSLRCLSLNGTAITDAGLAHLKGLTGLAHLYLSGTAITDAGLANLSRLVALENLDLRQTRVTDRGMIALKPLTVLRYVDVEGTQVTGKGPAAWYGPWLERGR